MSLPLRSLALLGLIACTGEGDVDAPDPSLEVGTGETEFVSLSEGDAIEIIEGPQGGYHFNGSVRAIGINAGNPDDLSDPDNPTIIFRAFDNGTQVDMGIEYTQALRDAGEAHTYHLLGRRVLLDIGLDSELDGHDVALEVEISDVDGNTLVDRRELVAVPHPLNGTLY